jgi:hypothetical protein
MLKLILAVAAALPAAGNGYRSDGDSATFIT